MLENIIGCFLPAPTLAAEVVSTGRTTRALPRRNTCFYHLQVFNSTCWFASDFRSNGFQFKSRVQLRIFNLPQSFYNCLLGWSFARNTFPTVWSLCYFTTCK